MANNAANEFKIQDSTISSQSPGIGDVKKNEATEKPIEVTPAGCSSTLVVELAPSTSTTKTLDTTSRKRQRKLRYQPKNVEFENEFSKMTEYYKDLSSTGDVKIPRALVVDELIKASKKEINSMMTAISQNAGAKTVLQRLPRHMRRRAASHNVKRLPKRYHQLADHLNSVKTLSNAECRKKRRRKVVLQNKYAKKSHKPEWLETHLWHAKRFHMSSINDKRYDGWGKYLALHANDKSFKASYRAVNNHCLIQDISYLNCIQITCENNNAINEFLTFISINPWNFGRKESERKILLKNTSTNKLIGPAKVISGRDPIKNDHSSEIWIWLHPLMLAEVKETIEHAIDSKFKTLQWEDVSDNYNRFRLTGPKSFATLLSVLRPFNSEYLNLAVEFENWLHSSKQLMKKKLNEFNEQMVLLHKKFYSDDIEANITGGKLFDLVVNDPRLTLPTKRTKPKLTPYHIDNDAITENDDVNFETVLWNKKIVNDVASTKKSDAIVSTKKHNLKMQGGNVMNKNEILDNHVPVVVVYNEGFQGKKTKFFDSNVEVVKHSVHSGPCRGFSAGCDLIIPKNWATAFWIPFVYHLGRAGGLRENQYINLQCLEPHFPQDYPDTKAGQKWWNNLQHETSKTYYKKPPAKRSNYTVLGTPSPFKPNWNLVYKKQNINQETQNNSTTKAQASGVLIMSGDIIPAKRHMDENSTIEPVSKKLKSDIKEDELNENDEVVSVMRCKETLNDIVLKTKDILNGVDKECINHLSIKYSEILIPIRVLSLAKGVPENNAMICAPTGEDLKELCDCFTNPYKSGLRSLNGPIEPPNWKQTRAEFKKRKKEAKNKKEKNKSKPLEFDVKTCRTIIGYLTSADYLLTYACGGGVGFISLHSLLKAVQFQSQHPGITEIITHPKSHAILFNKSCFSSFLFVLFKNPDTAQYRFAKLEIIK